MKSLQANVKYLSRKYGKEWINKFLICDVIKRKEEKQRSHVAISWKLVGEERERDKPGKSRPSDFDGQPILAATEGDEELDSSNASRHSTIVCRLKNLKRVQERLIISFKNPLIIMHQLIRCG
uniref:Uncharacterized protein n=1 Tax=Glossina austeni TaxID=7395 RepID=A0A1A9V4F9_GLOAU